MDNTQKCALIALVAVAAGFIIYATYTVNTESARLQAEQEAEEQAYQEHIEYCDEWANDLEDRTAEYEGRSDSLGGALDLDGKMGTFRNQLNLDADRYNAECAGEETHYYEDNL